MKQRVLGPPWRRITFFESPARRLSNASAVEPCRATGMVAIAELAPATGERLLIASLGGTRGRR